MEPLGAETILHFDAKAESARADQVLEAENGNGSHLTARLDGQAAIEAGECVRLAVDLERLHFFDRKTGAAIA